MAKNKPQRNNKKNSKGPVEKMYDATIGRICRRHRRSQASARTAKTPLSEPSRVPTSHYYGDPSQEAASTCHVGKSEGKKLEHAKTNQKFNDAGQKRISERRDSLNDKVMNYINKTRMKLARTTTTTVGDDNKGA